MEKTPKHHAHCLGCEPRRVGGWDICTSAAGRGNTVGGVGAGDSIFLSEVSIHAAGWPLGQHSQMKIPQSEGL